MREKTRGYIQLIRPYSAYLIPIVIVLAAIGNNELDVFHLITLFIIGISLYISGNIQNDYFDFEIDKKSKYVSKRPLVNGAVSPNTAFFLWVFFDLLSVVLLIIMFPKVLPFLALVLSFLLITLYNKFSKNAPGMEFILGGGISFAVLFGALTVTDNLKTLPLVIAFLIFLKYVFNVGISANIKDIKFDREFGLKTTPMLLGVKLESNELYIPKKFFFYAFSIKILYIGIALIPFVLGVVSFKVYNTIIPVILFVMCSAGILYTIYLILSTPASKRDKMLFFASIHEYLTYLLIPIIMMAFLVENINLLFFLLLIFGPPIWMFISLKVFFEKGKPNE